ncbi:hypothetical protein H3146_04035 [Streptomyces sp. OF3]|uniref:Uncharacterized protein n=1 Tax=Streptomyces alkaliterrae TaxID=2213162 RepID=A0A7W3WI02_9ACTN|nr:hypothetical protein [Streptomyces alkaliterrae]MBB1252545.1 hypothetical protein [Streptomyces alkaliterrae]
MPVSLALCIAAVLVAMLLLVAAVAWSVLRRVDRVDLPVALLGLAHVISALCGLLPWGKPTPPPALPQARDGAPNTEPSAVPTVLLVRDETAGGGPLAQRRES